MKSKEKKFILVLLVILAVVIIVKVRSGGTDENSNIGKAKKAKENNQVVEEYVETLDDGTKLNKSESLKQVKILGTLEFSNIQLTNKNGQSVLLADVKNTGSIATEMQLVDIVILDKNGTELGKVSGIVSPLEAGETFQFNTSTLKDYSNAYDFRIMEKGGE